MELSKVIVENFKCVSRAELELSSINILVGANGCGKSSVIQAIHLAACATRQAQRIDENSTSTIAIEELDYLPTDNYKMLGHCAVWGNKTGTPSTSVIMTFVDDEAAEHEASCTIRSARNAGLSVKGSVPTDLVSTLRKKRKFFSAYIPGISGIPNKEEKRSKKVVLKACSFGDSNIFLRNALLLLQEQSADNIRRIERWIEQIIGPISINVSHDNEKDLFISCDVTINGDTRPMELIGTGYIQLIQIFSYILLFSPGVLLVDEPDIHLHPTIQEKLVQVLGRVAEERKIKVVLTTHSPFIVRGAPLRAKVIWVNGGTVESDNRTEVELTLGWGAFGKKILIASEDSKIEWLKKLLSQWPEVEPYVSILPGKGYSSVPTPKQAFELYESLGRKFKILVHRDRDSLTDDEVEGIQQRYTDEDAHCWLTDQSDLEAYFCEPNVIQEIVGCSLDDAQGYLDRVFARNVAPMRQQFESQRTAHNQELYPAGGSPLNDDVWRDFQLRPLKGAKGKFVLGQLANVTGNSFNVTAIFETELVTEVGQSLRTILEEMLQD